jgi:hypothetical protein
MDAGRAEASTTWTSQRGPRMSPVDAGAATDEDTDAGSAEGLPHELRTVEEVCARWRADRADLDAGTWSGDVRRCDPGDLSRRGRTNALRLVNLYRFMVDLSAVETSRERDAAAQACALMMRANGQVSHFPPTDWDCYSDAGAEAAGKSNLYQLPAVPGVDGWILDPGNPDTLGHRRWILSGKLGPIGIGSAGNASCLWVGDGFGADDHAWTAWPPPGPAPIDVFRLPREIALESLDETGWSIQSDTIGLERGRASIRSQGRELRVTQTTLEQGYGSMYALRIVPDGWRAEAGRTYSVRVDGIEPPVEYDVEVVTCR